MLLRASLKAKSLIGLGNIARRGVQTMVGKNYVVPTSLKDCVSHLDTRRPTFTCVYFRAAWNPYCDKMQKDYENFCNANGGWYHMMVDTDANP